MKRDGGNPIGWGAVLAAAILVSSCGMAVAAEGHAVAWELSAYRIHVAVAVDPQASLPRGLEADLVADLPARLATAVGGYWQVEASAASGELRHQMLRGLDGVVLTKVPPDNLVGDKLTLLAVRSGTHGYRVEARELDVVTGLWNTPQVLDVPQANLLPHEALRAVLTAFAPLARIDSADSRSARLRLRGAALLPRRSGLAAVAAGTVFRPVLVKTDTAGNATPGNCQPIPWTYLIARFTSGSAVDCRLESGLEGSPIPDYHPHRQRWAVALAPPQGSTSVRLVRQGEPREPLEGYELWIRTASAGAAPEPRYEQVGTTDREGTCLVPSAADVVRLLRVQQGRHRFLEVPLVPGLEAEVTLPIDDDPRRVSIEAELDKLDDRLTDLAVQQASLTARIRVHRERDEQQAAAALQQQLDNLPASSSLLPELETEQRAIAATDAATQRRLKPRLDRLRSRIEPAKAELSANDDKLPQSEP